MAETEALDGQANEVLRTRFGPSLRQQNRLSPPDALSCGRDHGDQGCWGESRGRTAAAGRIDSSLAEAAAYYAWLSRGLDRYHLSHLGHQCLSSPGMNEHELKFRLSRCKLGSSFPSSSRLRRAKPPRHRHYSTRSSLIMTAQHDGVAISHAGTLRHGPCRRLTPLPAYHLIRRLTRGRDVECRTRRAACPPYYVACERLLVYVDC